MPSLDPAGLTFTVKFKFNRNMLDAKDEKFILDTGGWLGHGVSLFVHDSLLTAVVGSKGRVWVVCSSNTQLLYLPLQGFLPLAVSSHFKKTQKSLGTRVLFL